jgi:hypothetical protein
MPGLRGGNAWTELGIDSRGVGRAILTTGGVTSLDTRRLARGCLMPHTSPPMRCAEMDTPTPSRRAGSHPRGVEDAVETDLWSIVTWRDREIRFADSDDQVDADSPG